MIVEARGLVKRFGKVTALDGLTLTAPAGAVLAVLGPNGAGKSTFVRMIATLTTPDAGELRVAGIDVVREPERVRTVIGLAGQSAAVEDAMTGRENLELVARLYGYSKSAARRQAAAVLEWLDLVDAGDRLVRGWSGGMRRRLDLGSTLVGAPTLLLLDEPTTGLDPTSRLGLWEAVGELVTHGTSVVLTTQYLEEADHLADHVAIIDHGRTIAQGSPAALKSGLGRDVLEARPRHRGQAPNIAWVLGSVGAEPCHTDAATGVVTVRVDDGPAALAAVVRRLDDQHLIVDELALRAPTLDEVFLNLTGPDAEEVA
jgi:ABC-2 type transport system ATP-binding protein